MQEFDFEYLKSVISNAWETVKRACSGFIKLVKKLSSYLSRNLKAILSVYRSKRRKVELFQYKPNHRNIFKSKPKKYNYILTFRKNLPYQRRY